MLLKIARCSEMMWCLENKDTSHPCSKIVLSQSDVDKEEHHLPEPWNGNLAQAPLLFVSSNPSVNRNEIYPTVRWDDSRIADFFENRFVNWSKEGSKFLRKDGSFGHATRFNSAVKNYATQLLMTMAQPGIDYALTEVVHCKSVQEYGVKEATKTCSDRYLRILIAAAGAKCIVVLGVPAAKTFDAEFGVIRTSRLHGPIKLGDKERLLVYLPHTNARGIRGPKVLTETELEYVRCYLK